MWCVSALCVEVGWGGRRAVEGHKMRQNRSLTLFCSNPSPSPSLPPSSEEKRGRAARDTHTLSASRAPPPILSTAAAAEKRRHSSGRKWSKRQLKHSSSKLCPLRAPSPPRAATRPHARGCGCGGSVSSLSPLPLSVPRRARRERGRVRERGRQVRGRVFAPVSSGARPSEGRGALPEGGGPVARARGVRAASGERRNGRRSSSRSQRQRRRRGPIVVGRRRRAARPCRRRRRGGRRRRRPQRAPVRDRAAAAKRGGHGQLWGAARP